MEDVITRAGHRRRAQILASSEGRFLGRIVAQVGNNVSANLETALRSESETGWATRKILGGRTLYSANQDSPVFKEIKSLVNKTVGMHDVLVDALNPLRKRINLAFVYGSVARSRDTEHSDVDLMIVGKVAFDEVVESLGAAQKTLNREINPTVYSMREFGKKVRGNFLRSVLADKKLFIIGDEDDVRELGQQ
jgi:predicted nucleotidyltransferase